MSVTIEWGWWLLPFTITVTTFIAATAMNRNAGGGAWSGGLDAIGSLICYLTLCGVPSLIAWLLWSIFR